MILNTRFSIHGTPVYTVKLLIEAASSLAKFLADS